MEFSLSHVCILITFSLISEFDNDFPQGVILLNSNGNPTSSSSENL